MFQKFILIVLLICYSKAESQNFKDNEQDISYSISNQLYTKCFDNLNHGADVLEKYPAFKDTKACSILYCMALLGFQDKEIELMGEARLIGIATQLYREGNPVILIMGMESSQDAEKKNENLQDDNHIVYISYGECTNPTYLRKGAEIINKQTRQLIYRSNSL